MSSPMISVIIPVYKVEQYLPACMASILAQTVRDLEIILVDDGSPDGCGALCDAYAAQDARVRVIHKTNGGLSSARNAGIAIAGGKYLAFCDSDDTLEPDAFAAMLQAAESWDVPMVCAGRYDVDGATGAVTPGMCPEKDEVVTGEELVGRIFLWDHLDSAAWDKLYRAELFAGIRYPEGKIVEDVPTTYRLALKAGKAGLLAKRVYRYLHRENSITTASVSEKTFHFPENMHNVYADIAAHYPSLEPKAHYLLVCAIAWTIQSFDRTQKAKTAAYAPRVEAYREELRQHTGFFLTCPWFKRSERRENLLMALGLYRPIRELYFSMKKG